MFQAPKSILDPYFLSWHSENICWTELLNILLPYFSGPDLSPSHTEVVLVQSILTSPDGMPDYM